MATAKPAEGEQFSIHLVGEVSGKLWTGDFRAKALLTFRDKMTADRIRRELVGEAGGAVDTEVAVSANVIGQLSVRLTETPEWWKESKGGLELQDFDILEAVFKEALRIENEHLAKVKGQGEAAKKALAEGK